MKEVLEVIGISLVSEDFALIYGLTGVQSLRMTELQLIIAYVTGITLGDLGLFYCGRLGRFFPKSRLRNWVESKLGFLERRQKQGGVTGVERFLVMTRFLPGSRIPTYVTLGFTGYSVLKFTLILALTSLFYVSTSIALLSVLPIEGDLVWWQAVLVAVFVYLITVRVFKVLEFIYDSWPDVGEALRIKWYSLLRLRFFEFWSPYVMYFPIGIYIPIHMLRTGSVSNLLYTNPDIPYGGLIGESKSSMQVWVDQLPNEHRLRSVDLKGEDKQRQLDEAMAQGLVSLPFVMKPEEGQRGMGVEKVYKLERAKEYIADANNDVHVQELSTHEKEVGLFFIRKPGEDKVSAKMISATQKVFPFVVGDGHSTVAELVLADPRARLVAKVYKEQLGFKWESIPSEGEEFQIGEYGNHARGCIFEDATENISDSVKQKFAQMISKIDGFNIGRFDVRYRDEESFSKGENFHVIEINGAGAEETHIYDKKYNVLYAQWTLFKQWGRLYDYGKLNRKSMSHIYRWKFIKKLLSSHQTARNFSK